MYKYYFTEIAKTELDETLDYITNNLCNLSAAEKLFKSVKSTISKIIETPFIYEDCSNYFIGDENIRRAVIKNYILIYEIDESMERIKILRFIYYRRNVVSI